MTGWRFAQPGQGRIVDARASNRSFKGIALAYGRRSLSIWWRLPHLALRLLGRRRPARLLDGDAFSAAWSNLGVHGRLETLNARSFSLRDRVQALEQDVDDHQRLLQVRAVMDWIAQSQVAEGPLVSVILPTRDRRQYLPRAIDSVKAQSYGHWELIVVDDGSRDDTPAYLAANSDRRLRSFRASGAGVCAARNVGLREADGALIAYLDDDNIMHPQWLKSVVWAFEQRPASNVLYGAFLVDDPARVGQAGHGELPKLFFHPYDYQAVAVNNIADMGCIAHRAKLPQARFDESLREMGDWDLFLRLTREAPPTALPAIACLYTTDAPNRLTNGPTFLADIDAVRSRNKR
jgi:Glycosyl transferase family 2